MGTRPNLIPGSDVMGSSPSVSDITSEFSLSGSEATPTPAEATPDITPEAGNEEPVVESVKTVEAARNVDASTPATEEAVKTEASGEVSPSVESNVETTVTPVVESTSGGAVSNMEVITNVDATSNVAVDGESVDNAAESGPHNGEQDSSNELKSEHESTHESIVQAETIAPTPNEPVLEEIKSSTPENPVVQEAPFVEASSVETISPSVETESPKAVSEDVSTASPVEISSASDVTPDTDKVAVSVNPDTPISPEGESQVSDNQASSTTESTESGHLEVTPEKPTIEEVPVISMGDVMNAEVPSTLVPLVEPSGQPVADSEGDNAEEPQVSPVVEEAKKEPVVEEQKEVSPTTEESSNVETSSPLTEEAKNVNEGLAPVSSEVPSSEEPTSLEGGRNLASFVAENVPAADPEVNPSEGDASEQNTGNIGMSSGDLVEKSAEQDLSKAAEESSPKPEESEAVKTDEQRSGAPVGAEIESENVASSEAPAFTPVEEAMSERSAIEGSSQTPAKVDSIIDPVESVRLEPGNDAAKLVSDEVSSENIKAIFDSASTGTGNEAVQSVDALSTPEAPVEEKSSSPEDVKPAEEVRAVEEEPKSEEPKAEDISAPPVTNAGTSTSQALEDSSPKGFLEMSPIVGETSPSGSETTSLAIPEASPSGITKLEETPVSEAENAKNVLQDISTPENVSLNPQESLKAEINKWAEIDGVETSDEVAPLETVASSETSSANNIPVQDAIPTESFLVPENNPTGSESTQMSPEIAEAAGPGLSSSENVAEGSLVPVVPEDASSL